MQSLLVVDDEPTVRELLCATLRFAGFAVSSAATGAEAVAAAMGEPPDLVLLDVMLPDMDGFEVVRRLRELAGPGDLGRAGHLPVLFLTARDATEDKVNGLTLGGDDYVTKPFDLDELIARVNVLLRRGRSVRPASNRISAGRVELDPDTHEVWSAGAPVALSATEFELLRYLMTNSGR